MKIFVVLEGTERMIRCVTLSYETAKKICESFAYLSLYIETYESIEDEKLRDFLGGIF